MNSSIRRIDYSTMFEEANKTASPKRKTRSPGRKKKAPKSPQLNKTVSDTAIPALEILI